MLRLFFDLIAVGSIIGVFTIVYTNILIKKPILEWWYMLLRRLLMSRSYAMDRGEDPGSKRNIMWLYDPLVGCEICVAGQTALWAYLIIYFHHYQFAVHGLWIVFSIFFTLIIKIPYLWMQKNLEDRQSPN